MCFGAETSTRQVVLGSIRTTNPLMALSCMGHRSHHGLRWLHMLLRIRCHPQQSLRSSRHQAVAQIAYVHMDFIVAWGHSMDHRPHVVSSGIMDHSGPSRRSGSDSETFFILVLHGCPESGASHNQVVGLEAESAYAPGCVHHPAIPSRQ